MDITCVSDLHGFFPTDLPGGDLLIVAGDLTGRDEPKQYLEFNSWLSKQDYQRKIVIAGNHDNCCQNGIHVETHPGRISNYVPVLADKAVYLCDSGTEFEGLKIWGSPWSLKFKGMNPHCMAFTCDTEDEIKDKFKSIPSDVDILITHSPLHGVLDQTYRGKHVGSKSLRRLMSRLHPKLWVTAHIHEAYGQFEDFTLTGKKYHFVNASHVNERYEPVNKPIRILL